MDVQYLVVYCTCPDREVAERIANALVGERFAACVNILPGITSIYRWEERVQHDTEVLLIIKTRSAVYAALEACIRNLHPYEVAEIIALPIYQGSSDYLNWIDTSLATVAPVEPEEDWL